ncbi:MAG: hypothetical protein IKO14_06195 [Oscillibacter sp.]|nr:hypothetical protein [Oscillibacter sp.]
MAVVLEQQIGNVTVRIHDDYCKDKTPEDVRKILRRIANYVQAEVAAAELKKSLKSGQEDTG